MGVHRDCAAHFPVRRVGARRRAAAMEMGARYTANQSKEGGTSMARHIFEPQPSVRASYAVAPNEYPAIEAKNTETNCFQVVFVSLQSFPKRRVHHFQAFLCCGATPAVKASTQSFNNSKLVAGLADVCFATCSTHTHLRPAGTNRSLLNT